jgi:UDP-N-acetyl-2-amino-2-deoxyglucuronate dehydrogenase
MLLWIFGDVRSNTVKEHSGEVASGTLELEKASVNWFLSIDAETLPAEAKQSGKRTFRSLTIDGEEFEFSEGFTELHTRSYEEILKGNGFPIAETRKSIQLVHEIRNNGK